MVFANQYVIHIEFCCLSSILQWDNDIKILRSNANPDRNGWKSRGVGCLSVIKGLRPTPAPLDFGRSHKNGFIDVSDDLSKNYFFT